jgi:hypothetical protein
MARRTIIYKMGEPIIHGKGRNGFFAMYGIDVTTMSGCIVLEPRTSRGASEAARLVVPYIDLPDLIKGLQELMVLGPLEIRE